MSSLTSHHQDIATSLVCIYTCSDWTSACNFNTNKLPLINPPLNIHIKKYSCWHLYARSVRSVWTQRTHGESEWAKSWFYGSWFYKKRVSWWRWGGDLTGIWVLMASEELLEGLSHFTAEAGAKVTFRTLAVFAGQLGCPDRNVTQADDAFLLFYWTLRELGCGCSLYVKT